MDSFAEKSDLNTVALEVEGKKLWICPQQLACQSEVFKNLFFGDYRDKNQESIIMEGKTLDTFVPFLTCLTKVMPNHTSNEVIEKSYLDILLLADEYQVQPLKEYLETFIMQEVIPKLDAQKMEDKKELMKILIFTSEWENRSVQLFNAAYNRVLSLDVEFILSYQGKVNAKVYQDLTVAKLRGCLQNSQMSCVHRYFTCSNQYFNCGNCSSDNVAYNKCDNCHMYRVFCRKCGCTIINGWDPEDGPRTCGMCGKVRNPILANSCICDRRASANHN